MFIIGAVLLIVSLVFLFLSVRSFLQKGPIMKAAYFVESESVRAHMRTKKNYFYHGGLFLILGIIFLFMFISFAANIDALFFAAAGLVVVLVAYIMLFKTIFKNN